MRTVRVFVSSPGDVEEERQRARRAIERVSAWFSGRAIVKAVLWEDAPLRATASFQIGIDELLPLEEIDVAVFVLWSRLGTPLSEPRYRGMTGTEWEYSQARAAFEQRHAPDILVYRRNGDPAWPSVTRDGKEKLDEAMRQWEALESFIRVRFRDSHTGSFTAAYHGYGSPDGFEEKFERHLRGVIAQRLARGDGVAPAWTKGSPFRGLLAFDIEHASVFFGRARATAGALAALREQAGLGAAFLLILGASGAGKSSLARAGLFASLNVPADVEPTVGAGFVVHAILRPGDGADPFESLVAALLGPRAFGPTAGGDEVRSDLSRAFRESPASTVAFVRDRLGQIAAERGKVQHLAERPVGRLALLVDQLEELFSIGNLTCEVRRAFGRTLDALARSGVAWVVATLRSDYYGHLADMPELEAARGDGVGQFDLYPPTPGEIAEIVRLPAESAGLVYERDPRSRRALDEALIEGCAADPAALPLLQFTLASIYDSRNGTTMPWSAYEALRGLEGALVQRAEDAFRSLPSEAQEALPSLVRALVDVGEADGSPAIRRRPMLDDLRRDAACGALVAALIEARLLESDRGASGQAVLGVAHEALLASWPRFADTIASDRELIQLRGRISRAAAHWSSHGREPTLLLADGFPMRDGRRLLEAKFLDLDRATLEYVTSSLDAGKARAQAARTEASLKGREHAALRETLLGMESRLEVSRARVFQAYATSDERAAFAREERAVAEARARGDRLSEEGREALERAARVESASGGVSRETRASFAEYFMARWREAIAEQDDLHARLARDQAEAYDKEAGHHAKELAGRGTLRIQVDASGATVYLFRYEPYETVRADPPVVTRLVPIPTTGHGLVTRARGGSWSGDPSSPFYAGDPCLVVVAVAEGSPADAAGLARGDLVIRIAGEPCGEGLFVTHVSPGSSAAAAGVRPHHRVELLDGVIVEGTRRWRHGDAAARAALSDASVPMIVTVSDGGRYRVQGPRGGCTSSELGLRILDDEDLVSCQEGPTDDLRLLCLRNGVPIELVIPTGQASGLSVEPTAYPLIFSQENTVGVDTTLDVEPGSYLLLVRAKDKEDQRYPIVIPRLGHARADVRLLDAGTTPPGFVYVPPGPFIYGGDPDAFQSAPHELRTAASGLFVARRLVTYGDWFDFVNAPETLKKIGVARERGTGVPYIPRDSESPFGWSKPNDDGTYRPDRFVHCSVLGVSRNDISDYLDWLNGRRDEETSRFSFDLPTESEWEHAARGADGRRYPWGSRFDFSLCISSHHGRSPLDEVPGGFELRDESPFAVMDMAGSRCEWTRDPFSADAGTYPLRGGSWSNSIAPRFRLATRLDRYPSYVSPRYGFRLVARPRPVSSTTPPSGA